MQDEFLKEAKELRPLLKPSYTYELAKSPSNESTAPNSEVGHKSSGLNESTIGEKRRKKVRTSNDASVIAGHVGSGIGSPRDLADPEETKHEQFGTSRKPARHHSSNYSIKFSDSIEDTKNFKYPKVYDNEYPDPKVAARLASNERL